MQWQTQTVNVTTNLNVKIDFILHEFSATKIVMWDYYLDDSSEVGYNMILDRDLLTSLWLIIKVPNLSLKQVMEIWKIHITNDLFGYILI